MQTTLVAHLVPAGAGRPAEADIRAALREQLPGYMVPAAFYWHDSLPLTGNGKVDRSRLATLAAQPAAATAGALPDSRLERAVAAVWARILKVPEVDATATRPGSFVPDAVAPSIVQVAEALVGRGAE